MKIPFETILDFHAHGCPTGHEGLLFPLAVSPNGCSLDLPRLRQLAGVWAAAGQDSQKMPGLASEPALFPKTALHRGPPALHSRPLIAGCTHLPPQEGQVGRETAPFFVEVGYFG